MDMVLEMEVAELAELEVLGTADLWSPRTLVDKIEAVLKVGAVTAALQAYGIADL